MIDREPKQIPMLNLDAIIDKFAGRVAVKVAELMKYTATNERELLTVRETAERIGRSPGAVHQLIARGDLPCVRHGRRVHVRLRDLQNWIEKDAA